MKAACKCAIGLLMFLPGIAPCGTEASSGKSDGNEEAASNGFNLWVNPGFLTYHFNRDAGLRGLNWGAGVQADVPGNLSFVAGNYINSDYVRSDYVALAWQPLSWHSVRIGLLGGAVNGYPGVRDGGWFPAALPWVSIRSGRVGVNLTYAPNYPRGLHRAAIAQVILRVW